MKFYRFSLVCALFILSVGSGVRVHAQGVTPTLTSGTMCPGGAPVAMTVDFTADTGGGLDSTAAFQTIVINLPAGFTFDLATSTPSLTLPDTEKVSNALGSYFLSVSSTSMTILYTMTRNTPTPAAPDNDQLLVTGLQVKAGPGVTEGDYRIDMSAASAFASTDGALAPGDSIGFFSTFGTPTAPLIGGFADLDGCQGASNPTVTWGGTPPANHAYLWYASADTTTVVDSGVDINTAGEVNMSNVGITNLYFVAYNDTSQCRTNALTVPYEVLAAPAAPTVSSSYSACVGSDMPNLTATGGTTYSWWTNAGGTAAAVGSGTAPFNPDEATYSTASPTTWPFFVFNTNAAGCRSLTGTQVNVPVNALPAAPTLVSSQEYVCDDASTLPNLSALGANISWYEIDADPAVGTGGSTFDPAEGTYDPAAAVDTNYDFYATQTVDGCESAASATARITVKTDPPAADFLGLLAGDPVSSGDFGFSAFSGCETVENYTIEYNSAQPNSTFAWSIAGGTGVTVAGGGTSSAVLLDIASGATTSTVQVVETSQFGCAAPAQTVDLEIITLPVLGASSVFFTGATRDISQTQGTQEIQQQLVGTPGGGSFLGEGVVFSDITNDGIPEYYVDSDLLPTVGTFDPPYTFTITYTVNEPGCPSVSYDETGFRKVAANALFVGLQPGYCANHGTVNLQISSSAQTDFNNFITGFAGTLTSSQTLTNALYPLSSPFPSYTRRNYRANFTKGGFSGSSEETVRGVDIYSPGAPYFSINTENTNTVSPWLSLQSNPGGNDDELVFDISAYKENDPAAVTYNGAYLALEYNFRSYFDYIAPDASTATGSFLAAANGQPPPTTILSPASNWFYGWRYQYLQIYDTTNIAFNANLPDVFCSDGDPVTLTNAMVSQLGGTGYSAQGEWTILGPTPGTTTTNTPSASFNPAALYAAGPGSGPLDVTIIYTSPGVTAGNCQSTIVKTVQILAEPVQPNFLAGRREYCNYPGQVYEALDTDQGTMNWYDGDPDGAGNLITTANTYTPPSGSLAVGTTDIFATYVVGTTGCESDAASVTLTVHGLPSTPSFTNQPENDICQGQPLVGQYQVTASPAPSQDYRFVWFVDRPLTDVRVHPEIGTDPLDPLVTPANTEGAGNVRLQLNTLTASDAVIAATRDYYVQTWETRPNVAGGYCASGNLPFAVTRHDQPSPPVFTDSVAYCIGTPNGALANITMTGSGLNSYYRYYSAQSGLSATGPPANPTTGADLNAGGTSHTLELLGDLGFSADFGATPGTYRYYFSVVLQDVRDAGGNCYSEYDSLTIFVPSRPAAPTYASNFNRSYCEGEAIQTFEALPNPNHTIRWYPAGSGVDGNGVPTGSVVGSQTTYTDLALTSSAGGRIYQATQVDQYGCAGPAAELAINVIGTTTPPLLVDDGFMEGSPGNYFVRMCTDEDIQTIAIASPNLGAQFEYRWFLDDGSANPPLVHTGTSVDTNSQLDVTVDDLYDYQIALTTLDANQADGACEGSPQQLQVRKFSYAPPPTIVGNPSAVDEYCRLLNSESDVTNALNFFVNSQSAATLRWYNTPPATQRSFAGGNVIAGSAGVTSSEVDPIGTLSLSRATPGDYTIYFTQTDQTQDNCQSDPLEYTFTVNPLPTYTLDLTGGIDASGAYCENGGSVSLTASVDRQDGGSTVNAGAFTGSGITDASLNDGLATFSPTGARSTDGAGNNADPPFLHQLAFNYTDPLTGCPIDDDERAFTIGTRAADIFSFDFYVEGVGTPKSYLIPANPLNPDNILKLCREDGLVAIEVSNQNGDVFGLDNLNQPELTMTGSGTLGYQQVDGDDRWMLDTELAFLGGAPAGDIQTRQATITFQRAGASGFCPSTFVVDRVNIIGLNEATIATNSGEVDYCFDSNVDGGDLFLESGFFSANNPTWSYDWFMTSLTNGSDGASNLNNPGDGTAAIDLDLAFSDGGGVDGGAAVNYEVIFRVTEDANGCTSTDTTNIFIHADPIVDFDWLSTCIDKDFTFFDPNDPTKERILPIRFDAFAGEQGGSQSVDPFTSFQWSVISSNFQQDSSRNDLGGVDLNTDVVDLYFEDYGTATVNLATTTQYCSRSRNQVVTLDPVPQVVFDWEGICRNSAEVDVQTQFIDRSVVRYGRSKGADIPRPVIQGDLVDGPNGSWSWSFADGTTQTGFQNADERPTHEYVTDGAFDVDLAVTTRTGCASDTTLTVNIVPTINVSNIDPYESNGLDSWFTEGNFLIGNATEAVRDTILYGAPTTWQPPAPPSPNGDTEFWHTEGYHSGMNAWVYTACLNIATLDRPMMYLDVFNETRFQDDGLAVQVAEIPTGGAAAEVNWETLGTLDFERGINWYTTNNIRGNPGLQSEDRIGWSGRIGQDEDGNPEREGDVDVGGVDVEDAVWHNTRFVLDDFENSEAGKAAGTTKVVQLRMAFGAVNNYRPRYRGSAFTNLWVGSRDRRVLTEQFTANGSRESLGLTASDPLPYQESAGVTGLYQVPGDVEGPLFRDMFPVEMHTSFPAPDYINLRNPSDPSSRAVLYGVSEVPTTVIDGNQYKALTDQTSVTNQIERRSLIDPQFDILGEVSNGALSNQIDYDVTVRSRQAFGTRDIRFYMAIVEDNVPVLSGPGDFSHYVLVDIVPNPSGLSLGTVDWTEGREETINFTWNVDSYLESEPISGLRAVVFAQDVETKEVYQTHRFELSNTLTRGVVGLDPSIVANMRLYPNPASDRATLFLGENAHELTYRVMDVRGLVVREGVIPQGTDSFELDVSRLSEGMYFWQLGDEEGNAASLKLQVIR